MLALDTNLYRTFVSICGIIGCENIQLYEIGGIEYDSLYENIFSGEQGNH